MKKSTTMRAFLGSVILLAGLFGLTTTAYAYQGEVFVCNYIGDSDVDDILKTRDNYVKQAKKEGITLPASFLWSHIQRWVERGHALV